jgi:hypothetical protein
MGNLLTMLAAPFYALLDLALDLPLPVLAVSSAIGMLMVAVLVAR